MAPSDRPPEHTIGLLSGASTPPAPRRPLLAALSLGPLMRRRTTLLVYAATLTLLAYLALTHLRPRASLPLDFPPPSSSPPSSPPPANASAPILLVAAYFPLTPAASAPAYHKRLARFLGTVRAPIHLFAPPAHAQLLRALRGALPLTIDTTYDSPFGVPPLAGLEDAYAAQPALDRSAHGHRRGRGRGHGRHTGAGNDGDDDGWRDPEVYALRTAVPFFLRAALDAAPPPAAYEYAFWVDAAPRDGGDEFADWPDAARVREVWAEGARRADADPQDLLFVPVDPAGLHASMRWWSESMGPIYNSFSSGTLLGGPPRAIAHYTHAFYAYHAHFLALHTFVGSDAALLNAYLLRFPARAITFAPSAAFRSSPAPAPGSAHPHYSPSDRSYAACAPAPALPSYTTFFLASPADRAAAARRWWWRAWWRLRPRGACIVAPVVQVDEVLRGVFGSGWASPGGSVVE